MYSSPLHQETERRRAAKAAPEAATWQQHSSSTAVQHGRRSLAKVRSREARTARVSHPGRANKPTAGKKGENSHSL